MGIFGGSSSKSGIGLKWVRPYAEQAFGDIHGVYDSNAGNLAKLSSSVSGLVPGLIDKYNAGNPGVTAANGYVSDVLGGKYLHGNPFLQQMIDQTAGDVTSKVGAAFGSRGSFGGTAYTSALTRALAEAETSLRYGNYSDEMGRMAGAAGMAPGVAQANYTGLPEILQAAGAGAELPYTGINAMAGAFGNINNGGKSKTSTGITPLLQAAGSAASAFAAGGA
jgi:hypothetical protein